MTGATQDSEIFFAEAEDMWLGKTLSKFLKNLLASSWLHFKDFFLDLLYVK